MRPMPLAGRHLSSLPPLDPLLDLNRGPSASREGIYQVFSMSPPTISRERDLETAGSGSHYLTSQAIYSLDFLELLPPAILGQ